MGKSEYWQEILLIMAPICIISPWYMLILTWRCYMWCRKKLFLQSVSEAVVQDIKKLLQVHPMLVIATKSVIFWNRYSTASTEVKGWVLWWLWKLKLVSFNILIIEKLEKFLNPTWDLVWRERYIFFIWYMVDFGKSFFHYVKSI